MPPTRLTMIAIIGLLTLPACAEATAPAGWDLYAPPDAATTDPPDAGSDAESDPAFRRACITYVGGYNRMAVMGDADEADACVVLGFIGDGDGRSPFPGLELSPGTIWSLGGISAHPTDCESLPQEAAPNDFTPADKASGTIGFIDRDDADYPGQAVTTDIEMTFDDPPARLPAALAFSTSDLAIEGECRLLDRNPGPATN